MSGGINKLRKTIVNFWEIPKDDVIVGSWRDEIHTIGGWNPFRSPVVDKEHWVLTKQGTVAERLADAPFAGGGKNNMGAHAIGDYLWIWGGDGDTPQRWETWRFNCVTRVWSVVAVNLQLTAYGTRQAPGYTYHKGYFYAVGGRGANDTVRSADGIAWSVVGNIPTYPNDLACAAAVSFNGNLYLIGGVTDYALPSAVCPGKCWKSVDDGATWTLLLASDEFFKTYFCNACATSEGIFFIKGNDVAAALQAGMCFMNKAEEWGFLDAAPTPRHASSMCEISDEAYIVGGYLHNDVHRVKKIASDYRFYDYKL